MQDLGTLGADNCEAYAASGDGSAVVGRATNSAGNYHPFRWTPSGGMQDLPSSPPEFLSGHALDVSSDGAAVVGLVGFGFAERWTPTGGLEDLGTPRRQRELRRRRLRQRRRRRPVARQEWVLEGVRWTASTDMRDLGTLGGPMAAAYNVSNNGSVIVGRSLTNSGSTSDRAFRWTPQKGMQDLRQALLDAGVTAVNGWILFGATGVSADGTAIVDEGFNPNKLREASARCCRCRTE